MDAWHVTCSTKGMTRIQLTGMILLAGAGIGATAAIAPSAATRTNDTARTEMPFPASAPGGTIALASYGVAELQPEGGPPLAAMHVRAVMANEGEVSALNVLANLNPGAPWVFDVSRATLATGPGQSVHPVFANSDVATLPIAIIARGERRVIDLYFPLARQLPTQDGALALGFAWPMNRPHDQLRFVIAHDTTAAPADAVLEPSVGWGPHWWADPTYPWATFFHQPGIAMPRPPLHVLVTDAPTWDHPLVTGMPREDIPNPCDEW